jgi:hypothetical protein
MRTLTPQELAAAAAKRRVTQAANRAAGTSVRAQRAAAKAAKAARAGQPFTPPPVTPPQPRSRGRRNRFGRRPHVHVPGPSGPVFTTPAPPSSTALRLVAMAALEDVFFQKCAEVGVVQETRDAFAKYKKLKALALGHTSSVEAKREADAALCVSVVHLVKLTF